MLVVDTSAWIEWLEAGPYARDIAALIPERERRIVPTIVQLELCKWLHRQVGEDAANQVLAYTAKCRVVPLTTEIAVTAAAHCRQYGMATADAIIHATAARLGAGLVTCDAHFEGLPGVILFDRRS